MKTKSAPYYHGALTESKATQWKPVSPDTAAELLERNADNSIACPLTPHMVKKLQGIVASDTRKGKGKKSKGKAKDQSALVMRKGETKEQYFARLQGLLAG